MKVIKLTLYRFFINNYVIGTSAVCNWVLTCISSKTYLLEFNGNIYHNIWFLISVIISKSQKIQLKSNLTRLKISIQFKLFFTHVNMYLASSCVQDRDNNPSSRRTAGAAGYKIPAARSELPFHCRGPGETDQSLPTSNHWKILDI